MDDGLTDGFRWGVTPEDPNVGYTFISDTSNLITGKFDGYPSWGWRAAQRAVMEQAIEAVCELTFVDRGDDNDDKIEV